MSIKVLSPDTIRVLGATQCITSPVSVVKELIDNALDAHSTSLFIECAANLLDIIQVRDNGCGIRPDCRDLLGTKYCTSKIDSVADLDDAGGTWLGFRGEALASIAEISSTLTMTTRTASEEVGSLLEIGRDGKQKGKRKLAHPVGTTTQVKNVFAYVRVRQKMAEKQISGNRAQLKRMLVSYSFARPQVKFSFKIFGSQSENDAWVYAPRADYGIKEATHSLIGILRASQCEFASIEHEGFHIKAMLPRRDAEVSKVNDLGCFLSVDARPISSSSQLQRQVMTYMSKIWQNGFGDSGKLRSPFICFSITCPKGCYDANVEPAKDDVIFKDIQPVMEALQMLVKDYYHIRAEEPVAEGTSGQSHTYESHKAGYTEEIRNDQLHRSIPGPLSPDSTNGANPWIFARMTNTTYPLSPARSIEPSRSPVKDSVSKAPGSTVEMSSPFRSKPTLVPPMGMQNLPSPPCSSPRQMYHHDRDPFGDSGSFSLTANISSIGKNRSVSEQAVDLVTSPTRSIRVRQTRRPPATSTKNVARRFDQAGSGHKRTTSGSIGSGPERPRPSSSNGLDPMRSSRRDPVLARAENPEFRAKLQKTLRSAPDRDIRTMLFSRYSHLDSSNTQETSHLAVPSATHDAATDRAGSRSQSAQQLSGVFNGSIKLAMTLGDLRDLCIRYFDGLSERAPATTVKYTSGSPAVLDLSGPDPFAMRTDLEMGSLSLEISPPNQTEVYLWQERIGQALKPA